MSGARSSMSPRRREREATKALPKLIEDFLPELPDNLEMEGEDFQAGGDGPEELPEPHQDDEDERDESEVEFVLSEAEKDAISRLAGVSTSIPRAPAKSVKRPRSPEPYEDDVVPDLAEIFDNYDTPKPIRISICRAYASYLASTMPRVKKGKSKK